MIVRNIWEDNKKPLENLLISEEETETIALGYVSIPENESTQVGFHDDEEEIYVILRGRAILKIGLEETEVKKGSVAYVPRNTVHQMTCISEEKLEYLYFANWPK